MKNIPDKKRYIRNGIVIASRVYRNNFVGKLFLYTVGSDYYEVAFKPGSFKHLTGVKSALHARNFYKKANNALLLPNQIFFDRNHPYKPAKQRLPSLLLLPLLTESRVYIAEKISTTTITYDIGITNVNFTVGFVKNSSRGNNKTVYVPRTLRIKDNTAERSQSYKAVDFIFSKNAGHEKEKYNTVNYADGNKIPPDSVKDLLSAELVQKYYNL